MNNVQLRENLYPDDIYGEQNTNCFANGIMEDDSQNLDDLDQYTGYENQVEGYELQQEDEIGIFCIKDKDSDFDLNDYAMSRGPMDGWGMSAQALGDPTWVRVGFRGPTCSQVSILMVKNGFKMLENYDIT